MKNEVSMINVEVIDGVPTIKANGKIFVVPNHAGTINSSLYPEDEKNKKIEKLAKLCELNDRHINDLANEPLIQVWIVSDEELKTNNLEDHGFSFSMDGADLFGYAYGIGHLPKSFFDGKKEGDNISLKYKGWYLIRKDDHRHDMMLELNLELCQHEFRYRNFGQFEEVLSRVTR